MAKKRCKKKGKRKCYSFSFNDPLAYKLYAFFNFDGRNCMEVLRQIIAGKNAETAVDESISGYFQKCNFGTKFHGGYGTFYSVSLPDSGWFTFNNTVCPDSTSRDDLTKEITLVARLNLRDDGNTLTEYQFIGKHAGNGASANPFDFNCSHGGTPTPRLTRANADFRIHSAPAALSFDTEYTIAVYQDGSAIETPATWYKDGSLWGTSSLGGTGSGAATGGGQAIRIGRRADNALQYRGRFERILVYARKLTPLEHWQLHDDPDVMFREDDFMTSIGLITAASTPQTITSNVIFDNEFVRADAAAQSEVVFLSEFLAVESRGSIDSDVQFASRFTACTSTDIYSADIGDAGRYRR